ncbi:MAG: chemotaxis protein CheW [Gemmatimonadetes bacterium]|nr:chemotaxis protein CheW [Gemmatimonadota bacterium]NNM07480.1 chemotaxis protein CheW [Gemmatimonadota bacterium]
MLILAIRIGDQTYAVPTRWIVEVVPLVSLRPVPQAPSFLAGVCNYRGRIAPVIDLGELLNGEPCQRRLSTRIVFVEDPVSQEHLLGLIAEGVTETLELGDDPDHRGTTVRAEDTPYLGAVVQHEVGLIQMVEVAALMAPERRLPELLVGMDALELGP